MMRTAVFLFLFGDPLVSAFLSPHSYRPAISRPLSYSSQEVSLKPFSNKPCPSRVPPLMASDNEQEQSGETTIASSSDQLVLGLGGTTAALITFYSEYTLKTTGCGLPAGPFGLVGLVEGLSYLGVTGVVAFSLVKKIKTGSGLPAGPGGLLGAAEGLSFLAIVVGLAVLVLQVTNYGYIPNAVPMEGGMCS